MTSLTDQKNELFPLLQTAIELELATIPPYLTALLSIKPEKNRVAANLIRSVMLEEMLHMTLVGNLISSLGGKVTIGADNIPVYPLILEFEGKRFKERELDVDLAKFSQKSIDLFMQIELPAGWQTSDKKLMVAIEIEVPGLTIGDFYRKIEQKLEALCGEFSESEVFSGDPTHQIDENYYWSGGGKPIVITDLASGKKAIEVIVTQGEGSSGSLYDGDMHYFGQPEEVAHFFRFREIDCAQYYKHDDPPKEPPTGEKFEVDYDAVYPIKTNAKSTGYQNDPNMAKLNANFNRHYSLMLSQIAEAFNGTPEVLYTAINDGMHSLTSLALEMMSTPIVGDPNGFHGAPSFEWLPPY